MGGDSRGDSVDYRYSRSPIRTDLAPEDTALVLGIFAESWEWYVGLQEKCLLALLGLGRSPSRGPAATAVRQARIELCLPVCVAIS